MKKSVMLIVVLAFSLMASTTLAAAGPNDRNSGKKGRGEIRASWDKQDAADDDEENEEDDKKDEQKPKIQADKGKGKANTVTGSVYGDKGRQEDEQDEDKDKKDKKNKKDKKDRKAGERITVLLKIKYNIDVNAETSVTDVVYSLEKDGDLKAAADVQAEVVAGDPADIDGYKKLSKLKVKLGETGIKTYVNGKAVGFDVLPVAVEGRTLVPFRAIAESLEADVAYDAATKTITVKRDGVEVKLTLGSKTAFINGKQVALDVPGNVKNNRTLVPLRFLSEALDTDVTWDAETSSAIIVNKTPEVPAPAAGAPVAEAPVQ